MIDLYFSNKIHSEKEQKRLSYFLLGTHIDFDAYIKFLFDEGEFTKEEYENLNLIEEDVVTMREIDKQYVPEYVKGIIFSTEVDLKINEDKTIDFNLDIIISYNKDKNFLDVKIKRKFDLQKNPLSIQEEFTKKELSKHMERDYNNLFYRFF